MSRFRVLSNKILLISENIKKISLACVILHNMIRDDIINKSNLNDNRSSLRNSGI